VAEARARKRRRVDDKLEKAKKQAESILDTEEMGGRSKARAIRRVYRQAEASKKRKVVYAVHTNQTGKSMRAKGGSGGGGSTIVKHVDGRMKKEKRAMKRKGKKGGGRR
jgi:AdoMet-dependent rRNA methyltransferase SPB1